MSAFGLYIHLPFCKNKCSYCDYITVRDYKDYSERYINALLKEMQLYSGAELKTLYIGGGTPSIISKKLFDRLFAEIYAVFKIKKNIETTVEINPDDVNSGLLNYYKQLGINRLSLGIQSFDDNILKFLNRRYDTEKAVKAAELIAENFDNFSIDILFAIPEIQTNEIFCDDIKKALQFKPKHFAVYDLVIENKTYLGWLLKHSKLKEIDDDLFVDYYKTAYELLSAAGYNHYEISSYAVENYECEHNKIYWKNEEYIGLGAAAHSYLNKRRHWNFKFPADYIKAVNENGKAEEDYEILDDNRRLGETIMLNLHLSEGVNLKKINSEFNIDFLEYFSNKITKLKNEKLIQTKDNSLHLTFKGKLFANTVAREFL